MRERERERDSERERERLRERKRDSQRETHKILDVACGCRNGVAPTSESTTAAEWFARQNMSACFICENEVSDNSTLTFPGPRSTCGWYPHGIPGLTRHVMPSRYISQAENRLLFSRKRCFSHLLGPGARYRLRWACARVTGLCLGY